MNLMTGKLVLTTGTPEWHADIRALVTLAAQTVAPLWPLDSAIAVNPLSGFEEQPFEEALPAATALFGARASLPLAQWRAIMAEGRIDAVALRKVVVEALGGFEVAFAPLGPDINAYNLLLARLTDLPVASEPAIRRTLSPELAVLARWLAAFFDPARSLRLEGQQRGLYPCLAAALRHDPELRRLTDRAGAALIANAPADPLDLIAIVLQRAGVAEADRLPWLQAHVASLPGWAGHLRWRNEHGPAAVAHKTPATLTDLIALIALVRSAAGSSTAAANAPAPEASPQVVEVALLAHFGLAANAPETWDDAARASLARVAAMTEAQLGLLFQQAAEASYLADLAPRLEAAAVRRAEDTPRPAAQMVFCIDVRSEPMRRAIEAAGAIETFGYAGFFGLPIAVQPACSAPERNQLPVLLSPAHVVPERASLGLEAQASAVLARHASLDDARRMLDAAKGGAAGFATAEATGPVAAIAMLARTLAPRLSDSLRRRVIGDRGTLFSPVASNDHNHDHAHGMGLDQKIGYAAGMFRLTGMGPAMARLVVLTGHGGCTTNNAFAASLDCGACGGHPGGPNARLMASILNESPVRAGLAAQGLIVPEDTWFIAAQHDTTRDMIEIFDRHLVPATHLPDLASLIETVQHAGSQCRTERARALGRSADDLLTGAAHWAEVRPEWGLSGNAAFIVGPRALTSGIDLGSSAFLHSYDWQKDEDGSALTTILTAPMIVAQWINCQYLFSTIDNEVLGAGDKATQNVIGGFGVVQGGGGDLCTGLPRQSLMRDDGVPYHTPRRLTVIVQAPLQRVQDIVMAHDSVGRLVENGWVNLVVLDPWKHKMHRWLRGDWAARPC